MELLTKFARALAKGKYLHYVWSRDLSAQFGFRGLSSRLTIAKRCKHTIRIDGLICILEATRHSLQEDIQPLLKIWLKLSDVCRSEIW